MEAHISMHNKILLAAIIVVVIVALGTFTFHSLEHWSYVDAFYFTGITVTTIGYGDLVPTTDLSKIVTVGFAFFGVGMVLFFLTIFASHYIELQEKKFMTGIQSQIESVKNSMKNNRSNREKVRSEMRKKILEGTNV